MGGFWTSRSPASSSSTTTTTGNTTNNLQDDTDSVSVRPAPAPARALSTPFPTQFPANVPDSAGKTPAAEGGGDAATHEHSPRLEPSPLPHIPFVPNADQNPDLKYFSRFKADPSSILLQYPRSDVDHIHDFYEIYNPSEKGLWSFGRYVTPTLLLFGYKASQDDQGNGKGAVDRRERSN